MNLPFDTQRCDGGTEAAPCNERLTCARYIERMQVGMWTPVTLRACVKKENKIESEA